MDRQFLFRPSEQRSKFNGRVKHFPGTDKFVVMSRPVFNPLGVELRQKEDREGETEKNTRSILEQLERLDNIKRSRDKVYEIAFANRFTHFVTLTLDESKISRTDREAIKKALGIWLRNKVQRNDLKYVLIPEYHSDGEAIHFHGLVSGDLKYTDSGKRTKRGQTIYNMDSWKYGFSTAIELDENYDRIVNYILKYITKENDKILGRRYLSGGRLERSVPTEYFNVDYLNFEGEEYYIEQARLSVKYITYTAGEAHDSGC